MSVSTNSAPMPQRRSGGSWKPGQSGNPSGKPRGDVNIAELARSHAPAALAALVAALQSPKERVSAATVILDRAFGRPKQTIDTTGDGTLTLHLLAAQTIGRELLNGLNGATTIEGQISPDTQGDDGVTNEPRQLDQTLPSE